MNWAHGLRLSIVIPAYNEAENIADAVSMISTGLPNDADYEIIVVNDGSLDRTADILNDLANGNWRLKVISHSSNRGKGAALITGFANTSMPWVLFTDADLQIDISELQSFLNCTGHFDLVIGVRSGRKDSPMRLFSSRIYTVIIALLLGIRVRDINCPFKLINKSVLDKIQLFSQGFFIDAELVSRSLSAGYRIREIIVTGLPRKKGQSTVRFRHVLETVKEMLAMKFKG